MRRSKTISQVAASAMIVSMLMPVQAQETAPMFRMGINDQMIFSGSVGAPDLDPNDEQSSTILLQESTPFEINVNEAMNAIDLKNFATVLGNGSVTTADLSWAAVPADLPPGVELAGASLVGTPTVVDNYDFEIVATHASATEPGRQVYTIIVNGVELQVTQIAAGGNHTCAVTTAGAAMCWGNDYYGQLGDDTALVKKSTPVPIAGLTSGVAMIAAGNYHTCAVTTAGKAKCWGRDARGQLGDDTALVNKSTPVPVAGLTSGVAMIAVGANHTCAVTTAGEAKCWGLDSQGQLGDDTALVNKPTPVPIAGLTSGVAMIAAGANHTCALTTAGEAKCWGYDVYGQLGDDTALVNKSTPVPVSGLTSGVAMIAAGGTHTCAVTTAGAAMCWGYDGHGQLGDDTALVNKSTPVPVSGLTSGVAMIAAGNYHTCAVTTAGKAKCWGLDSQGQLGDDTALVNKPTPVPVAVE